MLPACAAPPTSPTPQHPLLTCAAHHAVGEPAGARLHLSIILVVQHTTRVELDDRDVLLARLGIIPNDCIALHAGRPYHQQLRPGRREGADAACNLQGERPRLVAGVGHFVELETAEHQPKLADAGGVQGSTLRVRLGALHRHKIMPGQVDRRPVAIRGGVKGGLVGALRRVLLVKL
jgi:hypothetical protein